MGEILLSVEIFLRIPGGMGYTFGRWLVKGSAARLVAAQKVQLVPSTTRAREVQGKKGRQQYCSVAQIRKS